MAFRAGFVTLWGRPNVGKSTFLNKVVGQKVAIVSDKPQTTRRVIKGILNLDQAQVVFLDTPGLHAPKDRLGEVMMQEIEESLSDIDILCYMTDPFFREEEEREYFKKLVSFSRPVFLILNKKDLLSKEEAISLLERLGRYYPFAECLSISCSTGEGVDELLRRIIAYLPENPPYYDQSIVSDSPLSEILWQRSSGKRFSGMCIRRSPMELRYGWKSLKGKILCSIFGPRYMWRGNRTRKSSLEKGEK